MMESEGWESWAWQEKLGKGEKGKNGCEGK